MYRILWGVWAGGFGFCACGAGLVASGLKQTSGIEQAIWKKLHRFQSEISTQTGCYRARWVPKKLTGDVVGKVFSRKEHAATRAHVGHRSSGWRMVCDIDVTISVHCHIIPVNNSCYSHFVWSVFSRILSRFQHLLA